MEDSEELIRILSANFGLTLSENQLDSESEYFKYIQKKLAHRIEHFISTDLDKLLQALYRIDVDQRLTDQAFELGELQKISLKIAELIINRQLQKIQYAKKFYKK